MPRGKKDNHRNWRTWKLHKSPKATMQRKRNNKNRSQRKWWRVEEQNWEREHKQHSFISDISEYNNDSSIHTLVGTHLGSNSRSQLREYVFLIGKETNAYTLIPIKIHLIQKRFSGKIDSGSNEVKKKIYIEERYLLCILCRVLWI